MTVGNVISKEMKNLEYNDAQSHIAACARIYTEFKAIVGFPDNPKDMVTLYVAYLTAKHQTWKVGIWKKIRGYWKAYRIKIILKQCIKDVRKGNYQSGDLLIKSLAAKVEKWL